MQIQLSQALNNNSLYDLISETNTKDLDTKLNNNKLTLKNWGNKNNTIFKILKYDKAFLSKDNEDTGKFRSVIFNTDHELVCYAPPKSISVEKFMEQNKENENVYYEEFIEGTMINMFYEKNNDTWEIATRTSVGGNVYFFNDESNKKTFYDMFQEVCDHIGFNDYSNMNKEYVYSFVMKHPDNRIVDPNNEKQLYLIDIYKCNTNNQSYTIDYISTRDNNLENFGLCSSIKMPIQYMNNILNDENLKKSNDYYASHNTPYQIMGIVIKNKNGNRCKIRNPNYEMVRKLRGNQPKLQYQYFVLRNANKVKEYLKYYKENSKKFELYRDQLHLFTMGLFQNYISCYIKKEKPLNEFPEHFRTHMYKLHHDIYMQTLKENKKYVNFEVVKNYVNTLHPSQQMYSVNYSKYNNKNEFKFKPEDSKSSNEASTKATKDTTIVNDTCLTQENEDETNKEECA